MLSLLYTGMAIFALCAASTVVVMTKELSLVRKVIFFAMMATLGLVGYRALNQMYGQPSMVQDSLKGVQVVAFLPDKANNVIYLWIRTQNGIPRNYVIPYREGTSQQLSDASAAAGGGMFDIDLDADVSMTAPYKDSIINIEVKERGWFLPLKDEPGGE